MNEYEGIKNLGDLIKHQLAIKKWSQGKLAQVAGVSRGQVSKLINNVTKNPTFETLTKIAAALEIDRQILINAVQIDNQGVVIEVFVSSTDSARRDLDLPIENILGRSQELDKLLDYSDRTRLILITGMVGIGKSTIAKALGENLTKKFADVIFFSKLQISIAEIMSMIKEDRYLLILDNLDHEEQGESYIQLLEQIAETKHQSCVVVTCRDLPKEYYNWEPRPKHLKVEGLAEEQAIAFLENQGLSTQTDTQLVKDLIKKCDRNPLLLKFTLQDILELYNGDLAYYLSHSTVVSGQFSELIAGIVNRLSALELELLYWLALKQESITFPEIRETFIDRYTTLIDKNKIAEVIKELIRRSLLQKNEEGEFGLQTVVQRWVEKSLFLKLHDEIKAIAKNNFDNLGYIRSLNFANQQIKLCDRFSRYESILIQALTQLESCSKEQSVNAIGYAIANLRYLLGKPIE
jgi:transcriptional regulator with XRE-family HTH domain